MTAGKPSGVVRRHIEGLDGIRASAAGLVLLFHYWSMAGRQSLPKPLLLIATNGGVGVDIFFVISGFILFLPWARAGWTGERVKVRRFLENRFLRIVPAFWFNTAVLVLVSFPALLFSLGGLKRLFLYGTFLAGFAPPRIATALLLNGVAWTLCIEVCFYLCLPLVARFFVRNRWIVAMPVVLVLTVVFKLLMITLYGDPHTVGLVVLAIRNIAGMFGEFAVGMVVAAVWARFEFRDVRLRPGVSLGCTVIGVIGIWAPLYYGQFQVGRDAYLQGTGPLGWVPLLTMFPLVSVFAGLALFGICYQGNAVTRFLSLRPIAYLGSVSYGIYLWHMPLGHWLMAGVGVDPASRRMLAALLVVGTAVTIGVAAFSHRFVEHPFLRRKKVAVAAPAHTPTALENLSVVGLLTDDTVRLPVPALSA